jgi:hypothetical protein|tara:strand:- start:151 stop:429 length:279 start_codon:yes stop_codon:yes gene_type:complete
VVVLEVKAFEEGLERIRMPTDRSEVHSRVVLTSAQAEVRARANEEPEHGVAPAMRGGVRGREVEVVDAIQRRSLRKQRTHRRRVTCHRRRVE